VPPSLRLSFDFAYDGSKDGERSRTKRRGRLVVGAFNPYHNCWHFVAFAVMVLAALLALGLVACKGRLGGLKATRGGCRFIFITYFIRVLEVIILCLISPSALFAFPTSNSLKEEEAKFLTAPKIFAYSRKLPECITEIAQTKANFLRKQTS
jgi:hypothetical protein